MNSKKIKMSLIFLCIFVSIIFAGCSNQTIQFKRESAFEKFKSSFGQTDAPKNKVYRNKSGVILLKDESSHNTTGSNVRFGPAEIKFDMPIKIK